MLKKQIELRMHGWGGRREGAGRKPGPNPRVRHRSRGVFAARYPAHVTLRVRSDVPSLRRMRLVHELERAWAPACDRGNFRLVHYSLQRNHVHLIVEASGREALSRGMKAIGIRFAKAVNRVFGRSGPVIADRYHLRVLRTPREVRNVLRYVLLNEARRRAARRGRGRGSRLVRSLVRRLEPAGAGESAPGSRTRDPRPELASADRLEAMGIDRAGGDSGLASATRGL